LGLVLALTLSGCHKATPGHAGDDKNNPNHSPLARSEVASASGVPVAFSPETRNLIAPEEVPLLEQINRENIKVVAAVTPSIVRITATKPLDPRIQLFSGELPFHFPFGPGQQHRYFEPGNTTFGSGVIISRDGYIVTNNHVVEDCKDLRVQLQDKSNYTARLIASDDMLDVAVLKIDATDLPALPWGDSDKVEVGEQVFAVGNPFDLDDSVTKGIVSAKGRSLPGSGNIEDYIQVDAAINPGNSGGALVNIHGELIGINAAIASTSRYYQGVGFSIPSNLVRYAVDGLFKQGRLVRGYLGVLLPTSIDEGVTNQLGLKSDRGALLAGVQPGSPADKAGLHPDDFITEVDNHKIDSIADLRLIVAQIPIGKEVQVKYIRDGTPQSTAVKVAELVPANDRVLDQSNQGDDGNGDAVPATPHGAPPKAENVLSGVQIFDLDDKTRQKYQVDKVVASGVVIGEVQQGSMAEVKGIERGDVIESACVNRGSTRQITSARDFADLTKGLKSDQSVVLLIHHGRTSSFIYLAPQK